MTYIEAPQEWDGDGPAIFLAGGITDCEDWQASARAIIERGVRVVAPAVLNPRRANFPIHDPTAAQAQIEWEFRHLHRASVVMFWFPGSTISPQPIALYELGRHAALGRKLAVGADPAYLRLADVQHQMRLARPDVTVRSILFETCIDAIAGARS